MDDYRLNSLWNIHLIENIVNLVLSESNPYRCLEPCSKLNCYVEGFRSIVEKSH